MSWEPLTFRLQTGGAPSIGLRRPVASSLSVGLTVTATSVSQGCPSEGVRGYLRLTAAVRGRWRQRLMSRIGERRQIGTHLVSRWLVPRGAAAPCPL